MRQDDIAVWRASHPNAGTGAEFPPAWPEVETRVRPQAYWVLFIAAAVFLLGGGIGFFTVDGKVNPAAPVVMLALAGFGGLALAVALVILLRPTDVRHAASSVLADVPHEPVVCEGMIVQGQVSYEVAEGAQGWEFRPGQHLWRDAKRGLFIATLPIFVGLGGIMTWVFHDQLELGGWLFSACCAIVATLVCGGAPVVLILMLLRAGYRRLGHLKIPRNGDDLDLDLPVEPGTLLAKDLSKALKWAFLGETDWQHLKIPRRLVAAVQLCPWKYVSGRGQSQTATWAVQGLLVLANPVDGEYQRLPLLLTSDCVRAAPLMQKLATALHVPYLFHADAEGWKAEAARAKSRQPQKVGGTI